MQAIDATHGLYAYQAWRKGLKALPVGTVLQWEQDSDSVYMCDQIKAGQRYKILGVRKGAGILVGSQPIDASLTYDMVLVSKTGKVFKKKAYWYVEGIARGIVKGEISVVQ